MAPRLTLSTHLKETEKKEEQEAVYKVSTSCVLGHQNFNYSKPETDCAGYFKHTEAQQR